jgi:hypothetical protein
VKKARRSDEELGRLRLGVYVKGSESSSSVWDVLEWIPLDQVLINRSRSSFGRTANTKKICFNVGSFGQVSK